jgi:predicted Zn finger-like uncharacterized protein
MDVRCPQCDTLYEIDARQLRGGAATLKCSQCDHVFRLQTHAALSRENQRRWMVRNTTSGDILYFSAFDQLHEWILQGKVGKSDQVSRTGKSWRRLEAIGEFRPIFQAVESISSISASHGATKRRDSKSVPAADGSSPSSAPQPKPNQPPQSQPSPSQPSPSQPSPSQPRRKVKTSPQFGVQGRSQQQAPAANAGESAPAEPAASQPSSSQPVASQPVASQHRTPSSDEGAHQSGSQSKVRLQTGAFGASSNTPDAADDGEWSFGDGSTLGEVEGSGLVESSGVHEKVEKVEYEGGGRRWKVVVFIALLLVAGGGAGVYFLRPDLLEEYLPKSADYDVVDIARSDDGADEDEGAKEIEVAPDKLLRDAVDQALASAARANATEFGNVTDVARPEIFTAVDQASEAAKKAAEKPDADELLASAQRYLESGNPKRARQKFHQVLDLERNNTEAITGLGWSLLALGSPGAASAQFRKALNYNPGFGNAYIGLGKAEREQGNHQAALDAYQNYLSRFPGGRKASIARYQAEKLQQTLGQ